MRIGAMLGGINDDGHTFHAIGRTCTKKETDSRSARGGPPSAPAQAPGSRLRIKRLIALTQPHTHALTHTHTHARPLGSRGWGATAVQRQRRRLVLVVDDELFS